MGILDFFRHIRDIWEYSTTGQFGALEMDKDPILKAKREPEDLVSPNLYIGKIMDDGTIKCEVVDVHKTNIHVKVLEIRWERLGTYLDVGKTYPVFKHSGWDDKTIQVWEISPKHMKRDTSQVILQWEEGLGWTWDLDF